MSYRQCSVFVYVLAAALSACASVPPTQYAQGVPMAPRAPSFNPTLDAPITVGQPGYVGPMDSLPRSPHGRVLPETPETRHEAGLWAGDRTSAGARPWNDREPVIVNVPLSEPGGDDIGDILMRGQIRKCAYIADTLFDVKMRLEDLLSAPADVRACLAAYAFRYCAALDVAELGRISATGIEPAPPVANAIRATRVRAERNVISSCSNGEDRSPWLTRWFGVLVQEWTRFDPRSSP